MTKVKAVCISENKGTIKHEVSFIKCIEDYGIENDAHAGKWHRQVSLMSLKDMEDYHTTYPTQTYGAYAENILVDDFPIRFLPVGSRIHIHDVVLEVTQIGKECHDGCEIKKKTGKCIMPQIGVFAKVIQGGTIFPDNEVNFEIKEMFSKNPKMEFHQHCLIVGAGALGQQVASQLVRLGFAHLSIVDSDCFTWSNFNRQNYASIETIFQKKVMILEKELKKINPACSIQIHNCLLNENNGPELLKNVDCLIDCVDDIPTKCLCEKCCEQAQIPMIHGAVNGWHGQVATILPGMKILETLYRNQHNSNESTNVVSVNMIASMQVIELIRYLKNNPITKQVIFIDCLNQEISKIEMR